MTDWNPSTALGGAVWAAGFAYDPDQDIIYSRMDALQRRFGYAYAYDRAALGMSAVIDCEPIFFDHAGKHWMIELWKGQYGLETGCEIGIYNRPIEEHPGGLYPLLDTALGARPGDDDPAHNLFFDCAGDDERLVMSATLRRGDEVVLTRGPERHWWLTGFRWGVLSRPEDLTVDITIEFPDAQMQAAFEEGLHARGYRDVTSLGNATSFAFATPYAPQPRADTPELVEAAMAANRRIVDAYNALGAPNNDPNQVQADFLLVTGLGMLRMADFLGRIISALLADVTKVGAYVLGAVAEFFVVSEELAAEWFGGAMAELGAWVAATESALGIAMDYSCVVEIDNRAGTSDLVRESASASEGQYAVDAPAWIPRGQVGRFVMHDTKLWPTGSGGAVSYRYCDEALATHRVTVAYDCPYGFWTHNSASVSDGPFHLQARVADGAWKPAPESSGHPLYVRVVAAG
ncbi:MAG: DUF4474 domain-containing protein [Miltoncostaeaceae bacterium]